MDKEEFIKKSKKLDEEFNKRYKALNQQYVMDNAKSKVGEFITDHIGTIKVEKISCVTNFNHSIVPTDVYHGTCYTKAGRPFKSGEHRTVYGDNVRK